MKRSHLILLPILLSAAGFLSVSAHAQELSGTGTVLITGCEAGKTIPGYKRPGFAITAYAHFACGSSVYVWKATAKTALVQQGATVAYVASRYVLDAGVSEKASPATVRAFLEGIAEGLETRGGSVASTREQLVRSCLASRGCRVEAWMHLAWTRIKQPGQLADSPESTLRLSADSVYYSVFVVDPPVRYKDQPLPSLSAPVLVVDGGGLNLAIAGHTCYTLANDGKWTAVGGSAVQAAAAIQ